MIRERIRIALVNGFTLTLISSKHVGKNEGDIKRDMKQGETSYQRNSFCGKRGEGGLERWERERRKYTKMRRIVLKDEGKQMCYLG